MAIHVITTKRTEEGFRNGYRQVNGEEPTINDYLEAKKVINDNKRLLSLLDNFGITEVRAVNRGVM